MSQLLSSLADQQAIDLLKKGKVGVIPTDTVYGLVARAADSDAISNLYSLKPRKQQPGTIIAASVQQLRQIGFTASELSVAQQYWPGPVSVVMGASAVADYLKCNLSTLPARIPNNPALQSLLEQTGPLMTTSANVAGEPTSTNLQMAKQYFDETVDFYVEGGDLSHREASTIIGVQPSGQITLYRQGSVHVVPSS